MRTRLAVLVAATCLAASAPAAVPAAAYASDSPAAYPVDELAPVLTAVDRSSWG